MNGDLIQKIDMRFQSGNSVDVDSVRISQEEWAQLKTHIELLVEQRGVLAKSVKQALLITSEYDDGDDCIGDCLSKLDTWALRVMGKSAEWDALMASQQVSCEKDVK